VCASFTDEKRRELIHFLKPYRKMRWTIIRGRAGRIRLHKKVDHKECPEDRAAGVRVKICHGNRLRPELVVEVAYDHLQGDRFRHTAQFRRWRLDKKPQDCTYDQLEVVPPEELALVFRSGR
jgi:ATP-dependent DNA ligase